MNLSAMPGLLLRLFSYWYDMDVIEEEAFIKWKEDLSQQYPGKGQALFQVSIILLYTIVYLISCTLFHMVGKSVVNIA